MIPAVGDAPKDIGKGIGAGINNAVAAVIGSEKKSREELTPEELASVEQGEQYQKDFENNPILRFLQIPQATQKIGELFSSATQRSEQDALRLAIRDPESEKKAVELYRERNEISRTLSNRVDTEKERTELTERRSQIDREIQQIIQGDRSGRPATTTTTVPTESALPKPPVIDPNTGFPRLPNNKQSHDKFKDTPLGGVIARPGYNLFEFEPGDLVTAVQTNNPQQAIPEFGDIEDINIPGGLSGERSRERSSNSSFNFNVTISIAGNADPEQVKSAAYSGVRSASDEFLSNWERTPLEARNSPRIRNRNY